MATIPEAEFSVITGMKLGWTRCGRFLLVELGDFSFAHDHAAHARADDHADAMGVFPVHPELRVSQGLLGGHEGELRVAVDPVALPRRQVLLRRKV